MSDFPEELQRLAARMEALEERVHSLEHPEEQTGAAGAEQGGAAAMGSVPAVSIQGTAGWFPMLGRAMLGIAGAYALRAVMESGTLAPLPVAVIALAYTFTWIVWATRAEVHSPAVGGFYAVTSVLILGPMLWELVLRFHTLSAVASAAVLGCFAAAGAAIAWKHAQSAVADVVFTGAAVIALALAAATHTLLPFVAALLLMALLGKLHALHGQHDWSRALVALMTDAAVGLLIFIYSAPEAARAEYAALEGTALRMPGLLLFAMDATVVTWITMRARQELRAWQVLQAMIAFVLAALSVLIFLPEGGARVFGVACLALSAMCYVAMFGVLRGRRERGNFRVFAAWSGGLLLAGAFWSLPLEWAAAGLAAAGLVAAVMGVQQDCTTLDFHGVIFLSAGALAADLPGFVLRSFSEALPGTPSLSVVVVTVLGAACYVAAKERVGEAWREKTLHLIPILVAACGATALLVQGVLGAIAHFVPVGDFHAALTRTLALCVMALLLAFAGARWQRLEATRIAYAALVFMAVKLFYEDLRVGRMEFIAGSIFLFAVTLLAVPRMARPRAKP